MRKRWMIRAGWSAALAVLALTCGLAGRAGAQAPQRPWLGVSTQEITSDLREGLNYSGSGVLVGDVVTGSPAARAGIKKGDVLVSFNSRTIDTPAELVEVVGGARVGQNVSLVIVRDGKRRTLAASLGTRPADDELAPDAPRAPKAPAAPRARKFEWHGDAFELPELEGLTMLRGLGRGRLGVQIQDLDPDLAEALGAPARGVLVTKVVKDTPAAKAGIKAGDVIAEVGGKAVDDVSDLHRELRDREGRVSVTLVRRGARRTVQPDIGDKPQVMRWESGDGDRKIIRIGPDREVVRMRVERDADRDDLEQQMRELREELRELRRKMEANEKP